MIEIVSNPDSARLIYHTDHARAWLVDTDLGRGPVWELWTEHPYAKEMQWTRTTACISNLGLLEPRTPLNHHCCLDRRIGTRELWIVIEPTHLVAPYQLVIERFVQGNKGSSFCFWKWRYYTRMPLQLPQASFLYEHYNDNNDPIAAAYAAYWVLTHPPDLIVNP